ncbi:hypothetical protein ACNJYA_10070 [Bradyrhizobium sp. DASA03068]|uniref:hypothetical protein n=1 Tax=Bradyrhizobium sp. BLXBL-01 TaxID=3395915 RepID=UPI003F72E7B7
MQEGADICIRATFEKICNSRLNEEKMRRHRQRRRQPLLAAGLYHGERAQIVELLNGMASKQEQSIGNVAKITEYARWKPLEHVSITGSRFDKEICWKGC